MSCGWHFSRGYAQRGLWFEREYTLVGFLVEEFEAGSMKV